MKTVTMTAIILLLGVASLKAGADVEQTPPIVEVAAPGISSSTPAAPVDVRVTAYGVRLGDAARDHPGAP
jgi:hypothetical protein